MEKMMSKLFGILLIVLGVIGFAVSTFYAITTGEGGGNQGTYGILPIAVVLVLAGVVIYKKAG